MWWVRFLHFLLTHKYREQSHYLDEIGTSFRVWPSDLDINMHLNNAVYLSVMDFARYDLIFRTNFIETISKHGWYPVVASSMIRYRRSLKPFKKYFIYTKVVGWDDRYFYLQQRFIFKDELVAFAVVKVRFLTKKGNSGVNPSQATALHDDSITQPELPSWVLDRFRSGPRYLGRYKDPNKSIFWWILGADQMFHHFTHIWIIWYMVSH